MPLILSKLALIGYGLSLVFFFLLLFVPNNFFPKAANISLAIGFLSYTLAVLLKWGFKPMIPVWGLKSALAFVAWTITVIYFILWWRFRTQVLGTFLTPLIVALLILSQTIPGFQASPTPEFRTYWLFLHITTSLLGDTLLAVAFCAGVMYLLEEHQIKKKHLKGIFSRLPSLYFLDTLNYHALIVGFVLLSIGLLTGVIYAQWVRGHFWAWDSKETWSLITWLVYAILIHQRVMLGWRGRQAAWWSIVGFGFLIFTFLGVNYLFPGYHRFG